MQILCPSLRGTWCGWSTMDFTEHGQLASHISGGKLWFQMPWRCWSLALPWISRVDLCGWSKGGVFALASPEDDGDAIAGNCKGLRFSQMPLSYGIIQSRWYVLLKVKQNINKPGDASVISCQADMAAYQILKPLFLTDLPLPWEAWVAAAGVIRCQHPSHPNCAVQVQRRHHGRYDFYHPGSKEVVLCWLKWKLRYV